MTHKKDTIEDLIKAIFFEAGERTRKPDNKNAMATNIATWIYGDSKFRINPRTLTRLYDDYIQIKDSNQKKTIPSKEFLDAYSTYLGFTSYDDFIIDANRQFIGEEVTGPARQTEKSSPAVAYHQTNKTETNNINEQNNYNNTGDVTITKGDSKQTRRKTTVILIIVLFIAIIASITLWYINSKGSEKLCLFWKGDRFESSVCTNATAEEKESMISPEEWQDKYKDFRKIQPTKSTRFFDANGNAIVWHHYENGHYEFYNMSGSHPLNGRKLLPVSTEVVEGYFRSIESSENTVKISDFDESYTLPEEVGDNEENATLTEEAKEDKIIKGKYCFKNQSTQKLTTVIQTSGQPSQRVDLEPNEQACVLLPVNNYSYLAFDGPQVLVQQGKFTVSENKEGYINLSIQKKAETATTEPTKTPETKPEKDCSKGDFCVKNRTGQLLTFRIKNGGSQFGRASYTTLTIQPGTSECFYDFPEGAYKVEYNFGLLTVTSMQYTNIRVVGCETREKTLGSN